MGSLKTQIKHIDCFSGMGGIATGFKAAGINTIAAIEKVESCVKTYKDNHPETHIFHDDIRNVDLNRLKPLDQNIDIVSAGMPCETFSTAGSKSRSFYDHRQTLFREAIRLASTSNAKLILFENVPAFTNKTVEKNGQDLVKDLLFSELSEAGFKNQFSGYLNAKDFGVPQDRNRFFALATKNDTISLSLPEPSCAGNAATTVNQALESLPKVTANGKKSIYSYSKKNSDYSLLMKDNSFWKLDRQVSSVTYHRPPRHRKGTLERFKLIRQGESLKDLFTRIGEAEVFELQKRKVLPKKWYIQRNRRLIGDSQSRTVTSHCLDEFIHPDLNRALTVREVARLQSFPDNYEISGGPYSCPHLYETQDKYEQLGDAVPPLLAFNIGKHLTKLLS